jgi:hypothetical protein
VMSQRQWVVALVVGMAFAVLGYKVIHAFR